ncbi:MAG: HAMP domain-containing sensor histidine kinase [Candidatus Nanopelagicales bacterium]
MSRTEAPSRFGRGTLQLRLTAGIVLLLTVACVLIAAATAVGLQRFLLDQLDAQLIASAARLHESLERAPNDGDESAISASDGIPRQEVELGEVPGLTSGTLAVLVEGGQVQDAYVIAGGPKTIDEADAATLAALPVGGPPRTETLTSGAYRLLAMAGPPDRVLIVGLPVHDLRETMARLVGIEVVVFVIVIALAGVAGAVFVRSSLRPLRRVARTANWVADQPLGTGVVALSRRVTDVDPRSEAGQVAGALNLLLAHVESSLAQRHATEERLRRFVADASHELRTPVTVIGGYAQLAQRYPEPLPQTISQALERIGAEAGRMATLVDDLLLLARLDSGRPLAADEVDLTRLVIDVVNDARAAAPDHHWELDLPEEPVTIIGDEHRLHQVLANLTSNARVHTPVGSSVTVSVHNVADAAGGALIEVCDDGPGIPDELQPELFERFVRGQASRTRAAGSTGLGLAIVAAVTAAHGGQIDLTSEPGRTCFRLRLPAGGAQHH